MHNSQSQTCTILLYDMYVRGFFQHHRRVACGYKALIKINKCKAVKRLYSIFPISSFSCFLAEPPPPPHPPRPWNRLHQIQHRQPTVKKKKFNPNQAGAIARHTTGTIIHTHGTKQNETKKRNTRQAGGRHRRPRTPHSENRSGTRTKPIRTNNNINKTLARLNRRRCGGQRKRYLNNCSGTKPSGAAERKKSLKIQRGRPLSVPTTCVSLAVSKTQPM